jgi:outer membrane immunogenic protein
MAGGGANWLPFDRQVMGARMRRTSVFLLASAICLGVAQTALAKPPATVVAASWEGFYLGGNVGYSWGRSETDVQYFNAAGAPIVPPPGSVTSASFDLDGWIGGGQIGHNWQNGKWVGGLEADIQWSGQDGSAQFFCAGGTPCLPLITGGPAPAPGGAVLSFDQGIRWFGTVRARGGLLVDPTLLAYVTGGFAYGAIKTEGSLFGPAPIAIASVAFSNTVIKGGWTVGLGFEKWLKDKWSGKIEYLYMDLGSVSGSVFNPAIAVRADYSSHITDNILRIGLNYHP